MRSVGELSLYLYPNLVRSCGRCDCVVCVAVETAVRLCRAYEHVCARAEQGSVERQQSARAWGQLSNSLIPIYPLDFRSGNETKRPGRTNQASSDATEDTEDTEDTVPGDRPLSHRLGGA